MTAPGEGRDSRRPPRRLPQEAYIPDGKFGPRRVRVDECLFTLRAQDAAEAIQLDHLPWPPSQRLVLERYLAPDTVARYTAERVTTPGWTNSRVRLVCPACAHTATALYVPCRGAPLACRTCWNLTYARPARIRTTVNRAGYTRRCDGRPSTPAGRRA